MRDDKDHNERLDDFSGYMRQRLEEHRLPVDAGGWDEVEARMNRRARSRGCCGREAWPPPQCWPWLFGCYLPRRRCHWRN